MVEPAPALPAAYPGLQSPPAAQWAHGMKRLVFRGLGAPYTGTATLGTRVLGGLAADDHLCGLPNRRIPVPRGGLDRRLNRRVLEHRQSYHRPPPDLRRRGGDKFEQRRQRRIVTDRSERRYRRLPGRPITPGRCQFDQPRNGRRVAELSVRRGDRLDHAGIVVVTAESESARAFPTCGAESFSGHRPDGTVVIVGDESAELRYRIVVEAGGNTRRNCESPDRRIVVAEERKRIVE